MRVHLAMVVILLLISFSNSMVIADTIDLNDFFSYPDSFVSVAEDGASAKMSEGEKITVLLSDDPYLGDPILLPSDPFVLSFSYLFTVAAENSENFDVRFWVKLFDANTGDIIEELSIEENDGSIGWTEYGAIVWNIVDTPSTDLGFGLEFQLSSNDEVLGSNVQINDVEVNFLNPVPESTTIFMFGLGLVGLAYTGRKNNIVLN